MNLKELQGIISLQASLLGCLGCLLGLLLSDNLFEKNIIFELETNLIMKHLIVIISLFVFVKSFSQNTLPIASSDVGKSFTGVETNITLNATDQDGDNLVYTLITPPTNGTATITDGILTYTSNTGFSGSDIITFKVNDGFSDSNEAQLEIEVVEKEANLNWAIYFSTSQYFASKQDGLGNTYVVGRFWDYSNFKDNTSLDAIYPQGGMDGYISKYNNLGELQWVSTFGGVYDDKATDIAIGNDGNIVVTGTIQGETLFSDGNILNSNSEEIVMFVAKIDSENGNILWNEQLISSYTDTINSKFLVLDDSNNIIVSGEDNCNCYNRNNVLFFKLDYSNGNILVSDKVLESGSNSSEFTYGIEDLELGSNGDIIITGAFYGTIDLDLDLNTQNIQGDSTPGSDKLYFAKYDSNFNLVFGFTGTSGTSGRDITYDSINDLIYLSGAVSSVATVANVNLNPLGSEVNISNPGEFVGAYDTNGILQFHHIFTNSSRVVLEVNDDKLLLFGSTSGGD